MGSTIASKSWRALRANPLGQLALLPIAAALAGLVPQAVQSGVPWWIVAPFGWCVGVAVFMASVELARGRTRRHHHVFETLRASYLHALAQSSVAVVVPAIVCLTIFLAANWLHPLLAFGTLMIPMVLVPFIGAVVGLAIASTVHGDVAWWPEQALDLVRERKRVSWISTVAGGTVALFAAMPVMTFAAIAMTTIGPLGLGLLLAAPLPFLAALALGAWRSLGGTFAKPAPAREVRPAPAPAVVGAWQAGPSWEFALQGNQQPWGSWVEFPDVGHGAPLLVGVTIAVSAGATPPRLLTCDAAGTWLEWPVPAANGELLTINLPAGASYVQIAPTFPQAHAVRLSLSVYDTGQLAAAA